MHVPVLCEEIMESLKVNNEGTYLDATFGWGGHTEAIFLRAPQAKVVAMDRDSETLKFAQQRFSKILNKNLFLMHGNFKDGVTDAFDGILIHLGKSLFLKKLLLGFVKKEVKSPLKPQQSFRI